MKRYVASEQINKKIVSPRLCLGTYFETLAPALNGETSFAYARAAGGGFRRQSKVTFSMVVRSNSSSGL